MNNIPFPCGKFASSLRKQLFREHLGLLNTRENINIDDAITKSFYKDVWCARSKRNTEIYDEVFHCVPNDKVVNFSMLKQYQDEIPLSFSDPLLAQEMIENIKVHILNIYIKSYYKHKFYIHFLYFLINIIIRDIWSIYHYISYVMRI